MGSIFSLMQREQRQQEVLKVMECNQVSKSYGLVLTEEAAKQLMECRETSLRDSGRVEFAEGILSAVIYAFCDSPYMNQEEYADNLAQLQEIFYQYKNESLDLLTDEELLGFMRRHFDETCFGDMAYLSGTCLERFARAIRQGYKTRSAKEERDEYLLRNADSEYCDLNEEGGWNVELFWQALENEF